MNASTERDIESSGILAQATPQERESINWWGFAGLCLFMILTTAGLIYFMTREQPCSAVVRDYENRSAIQPVTISETQKYRTCKRWQK